MTTAQSLVESCLKDEPVNMTVFLDYFGNARKSDHVTTVLGVYQMMVYRGVTAELLHNCLLSNRLNELVHAMYKHKPTQYYLDFCKKKIDLTNKIYAALGDLPVDKWMVIYDNNHCPNCKAEGYITNKQEIQRMCRECNRLVCLVCVADPNDEDACICKKCVNIYNLKCF